jgi:alpha/beta hydrolase family protein
MKRIALPGWKPTGLLVWVLGIALLGAGSVADARIRSINLNPPMPFPTVGSPYVLIEGIANGEIDPHDPLNGIIQDIRLAPLDQRKLVLYSTKIAIVTPADSSSGNHTMLLNIVNRGNPQVYDVGNDLFELKQGFSVVFVGWQADLLPLGNPFFLTLSAPVAHEKNGKIITGIVRSEFTVGAPASTQRIIAGSSTNTAGYPTVSLDNRHDTMTMRVHQNDPKVPIPNTDWAYADCTAVPFPGVPDPQKVCLRNGFDTNHIYELVYTARDPIVMGLGLAAIRDVGSFLRYEAQDDLGNANPLAGAMKYALLSGGSQSAAVLRTYLRLGFNEDEVHRQVFDGMQPERSTRRNALNVRFSQPGRLSGGTQHTEAQYPGSESPDSYGDTLDLLTAIRSGILDRCRRTRTCPKIVHTITDNEYWESSGAFVTADALGRFDLELPDNVRIYHFASTQHGGFSPTAPLPTSTGICQFLPNPNPYAYHLRALLMALQQWVAFDTPPPPSMYSRIDRKTLVPLAGFRFPPNPLLQDPEPQAIFKRRQLFYRGAHYDADDVSGVISIEPPDLLADYPAVLVPQVDADGNGIDGVRTLTLQVPLGTYTGWNIRRTGFSEGDACDLIGSYMPFALTKAQRGAAGDPRPSLEERYGTLANYAALATSAASQLVAQRLLLPSDAAAAIQSATQQAQQAGLK